MERRLSPETKAELRMLAREIGAACGLGEEAQEELYGHLEDKTLGYLSGEDNVTEADAVLLTREHFGMSGAAAGTDVPVRSGVFVRRLAAIAVYDLMLGMVFASLATAIGLALFPYLDTTPPGIRTVIDWASIRRLLGPGAIGVLVAAGWGILRLSVRQKSAGRKVWFLRWNPYVIAAVLGLLLVIRRLHHMDLLGSAQIPLDRNSLHSGFAIIGLALALVPVLWACVWMYWVARTNRSPAGLVAGAAIWFLLRLVSGHFPEVLLNLPLILTVTVIFVIANRLPMRYREFERGVPWINN